MSKTPRMDACKAFAQRHPSAEYGPTHVVISDWNTDDTFVLQALHEVQSIALFLTALLMMPEDEYGDSR